MKKSNKGFSMVELIIVIAIMAILAGALAPALIKYINKSRLSTDIQTGNTIATAAQTALANETAYDAASSYDTKWNRVDSLMASGSNAFNSVFSDTIGAKTPKIKSKNCMKKQSTTNSTKDFYVYIDRTGNGVKVAIGGSHLVFPDAEKCLEDDSATHTGTASGNGYSGS